MQQYRLVLRGEGVLPIGSALRRQIQTGAGCGAEFTGAGHEVGVNMGFGDVRDAQPFGARHVEIRSGIAKRIDHDGFAGRLASDHVARLRERRIIQFTEEHGRQYMVNGARTTIGRFAAIAARYAPELPVWVPILGRRR